MECTISAARTPRSQRVNVGGNDARNQDDGTTGCHVDLRDCRKPSYGADQGAPQLTTGLVCSNGKECSIQRWYLDAGGRFTRDYLFLGSPQSNCGPNSQRSVSEAMDGGQEQFQKRSTQCVLDRLQSRNPADGRDSCAHQSAR